MERNEPRPTPRIDTVRRTLEERDEEIEPEREDEAGVEEDKVEDEDEGS